MLGAVKQQRLARLGLLIKTSEDEDLDNVTTFEIFGVHMDAIIFFSISPLEYE